MRTCDLRDLLERSRIWFSSIWQITSKAADFQVLCCVLVGSGGSDSGTLN